jgi:hypothetical protein
VLPDFPGFAAFVSASLMRDRRLYSVTRLQLRVFSAFMNGKRSQKHQNIFIRARSAAMSHAMHHMALIFIGSPMIAITRITCPAFG